MKTFLITFRFLGVRMKEQEEEDEGGLESLPMTQRDIQYRGVKYFIM